MDREVDHPSREPEPPAGERPVVAASRELALDEDEGEEPGENDGRVGIRTNQAYWKPSEIAWV